ncbi:hypothetical protein [Pseudaestuariivita atlantica]|uniref:Seryl-tRNA synthetase n=1 Tax=Pseudaestuariivita atlantica TaxID=1317121 RepID=A0A0L1JUC6_9RHOB|nr:hypothetical protein [Pseudaestuariivita atlantica]KNG95366.1 seryl-tRNA synthetase [Pseudaestuariivita atlantica]
MPLVWSIAHLVAAIVFALAPFATPDFGGFRPDQFPVPQTDAPVQPAGYAFAIWGLIYVWLVAGAFVGLNRWRDADWAAMRPPLVLSLVLGAPWLMVAKSSVLGATVLIWLMLATALVALFRVGDTDRWWQQAPVAVYAGWLTAASSVSIGLMLGGYGILGPVLSALVALAIALAIAVTVQYRLHRAPEYGLAVIWALVGVVVANVSPLNIAVAGLAVIGILSLLSLRTLDTE